MTDSRTHPIIGYKLRSGAHCIVNATYAELAERIEALYKRSAVVEAEAWESTDRDQIVGKVWINEGRRTWFSE